MKKILRLLKETWFALTFYKNPLTYIAERLGRFGDRTICIELRNGLRYRIHTNTSDVRILNEIWNVGIYDRLKKFVHDTATVVDIGAHVGVLTVKAAGWGTRVKVVSYEPFPHNYDLLAANIRLNNLQNRVKAIPAAVAETKGTLILHANPHDSGGGSLYKNEAGTEAIPVPTVSLAGVFADNKIDTCDFMKIDCEGGEVPILTNAPRDLLAKVRSMSIEWHDDLSPMPLRDFCSFLRGLGFTVDFDKPTGTIYAARHE